MSLSIQPRFIRFGSAPEYFGMDRNRFNAEVRPYLTEIAIGTQGIAFDRLEMDEFAEHYKSRNGRPSKMKGNLPWDEKEPLVSIYAMESGISTNNSEGNEFAKALAKASSQKRRCTSQKG